MTASAAVDAVTCDGTPTIGSRVTDQQARFETDAIPYMRQMFPAAYRLTSDRCDAEDLVQETFARAYVKFDQFVPGTNLRAWLYCIMFRTFYSNCRKRSRKPAEVLAADLNQAASGQAQDSQAGLVPPSRSAEAEALDSLGDSPVMRALADLPPQFKAVLYLADIHGLQQSDIADIMGTPVGTVMSRLHRGRAMLRAKLRPVAMSARVGPHEQAIDRYEPLDTPTPAPTPDDLPIAA